MREILTMQQAMQMLISGQEEIREGIIKLSENQSNLGDLMKTVAKNQCSLFHQLTGQPPKQEPEPQRSCKMFIIPKQTEDN